MGKLDLYNLSLKALKVGTHTFEYELDNEFFASIDAPEVQRGDVKVYVQVIKTELSMRIEFELEGEVVVLCDRCLDDLTLPIEVTEELLVKFGKELSEEDEIIIVPEDEGVLNIAWFLYEFVALAIPIQHTHAHGECNKEMMKKYRSHIVRGGEEDDEDFGFDDDDDSDDNRDTGTDPRWDVLKNIIDNN